MSPLSWQVGDVKITRVAEFERLPAGGMIPLATSENVAKHRDWLFPDFLNESDAILACIQTFVVQSAGRNIVVDTCIGNDKKRSIPFLNEMHGPFLDDFRAAGFEPESIDTVLCTHLHTDHVGWNTRLLEGAWSATFPNARYLIGREEWEHARTETGPDSAELLRDSVTPLIEKGVVDFFETDHVLTDEIRLQPTPGHTPGHVSVFISSRGEQAVISGDIMHNPVQIAETEWCAANDNDVKASVASRRRVLDHCAKQNALLIGTHFPAPTGLKIAVGPTPLQYVIDK